MFLTFFKIETFNSYVKQKVLKTFCFTLELKVSISDVNVYPLHAHDIKFNLIHWRLTRYFLSGGHEKTHI